MKVAIIGLGYVGIPLACLCAKKGHIVYGIDLDKNKVDIINSGKSPIKDERLERDIPELKGRIIASTDEKNINLADIVLITVPTPVDNDNNPDLSFVQSATEMISRNIKRGQIIVLESTVSPGTVAHFMKPILEKSGLKAGVDFYLGHSPERVDPGNKKWTIENTPKVIGALSETGLQKIEDFYKTIITGGVVRVSSVETAEVTKIVENAFRDVNIAFVNELAKSFDHIGIDITEVIRAASTKPYAFMAHYPGCGVGGHCIAVDPYYLIKLAHGVGFEHDFLNMARKVNEDMPYYTVSLVSESLNEIGKSIKGTNITVLGLAYKKDVDDTRNSPAKKIIKKLEEMGANIKTYDPFVKSSDAKDLKSALENTECIVICTDHTEFKNMDPSVLKEAGIKIIVDGRNILDKKKIQELGIIYSGIGR